ncbi:MAG: PAS domain S-box protein [Bdellovibrionales bacterium]|nr:PAS domain S-box protein [Bdellovibrionales bacterium]
MTTLNLVTSISGTSPMGLDNEKRRLLMIEACRVLFLVAILLVALVFQSTQGPFISLDVWLPFYLLLFFSFSFNAIYIHFFDNAEKWHGFFNASLFGFDALFVTVLIYFTGTSQSVFLFLYLVNIILCGLVFQRKGALLLALWTSILFSFLMIIGPSIQGQTLYFAVGLNNIAFYAVAFLGGILSEQLNFMGSELAERQRDIEVLRDLNQMIVDNMATGLFTTGLDGIISQVNQAAIGILEDRDLLNKSIFSIFPDLNSDFSLLTFQQERNTNNRFEVEYKNYRGEKSTIEITLGFLRNADSVILGYVFTFQDLTQIKKIEYAMRQQEKMAAVGQLAAGIAHEIRNPLASISGSIQLLSTSNFASSTEDKKLMSIVLKEIDRLNDLITEFLDYVRPHARIEDPINLNQLIQEISDFVGNGTPSRVPVRRDLMLKSGRLIYGHRDKLRQALLNIVINAYQAMGEASEPVLKIETKDLDLVQRVQLRVEDNGCGIAESNRGRIFEPFHTTKPGGTGLGLAIAHKILDSHGATISVESTLKKGTSFIIEFPSPDTQGEKPRLRIA